MRYKRILISFVGLVIVGIVALSPWDAFFRSELRGPHTESVYIGNFPTWAGPMLGLDGQRQTVKKRLDYHNEQIAEYETKKLEPQANRVEIDRKIAVHKEERKGLLEFLFGSGDK